MVQKPAKSVRTKKHSIVLIEMKFLEKKRTLGWHEDYRDDFDDGIIDPTASWLTNNTDANRTIVEAGGEIMITVAAGSAGGWYGIFNEAPTLYQPIATTPPFEFVTCLNLFTLNDWHQAGIFIGYHDAVFGGREAHQYGMHRIDSGEGTGLKVVTAPTGGYTSNGIPTWPCPIWLKIRVDASEVLTFWYSTDGIIYLPYLKFVGGVWSPVEISGWYASDMEIGLFASIRKPPPTTGIAAPFEFFHIDVYEYRRKTITKRYAPIDVRVG